jgi:Ca-activated chloride channel family protein
MKASVVSAVPAAFVICAGVARAQAPGHPPTFGAEVDVVSVTAVVYDAAGRFIESLGPQDIEVYEDGVRQQVSYFHQAKGGQEKIPLSVVLALDTSGSMRANLHFLKEAAQTFVRKLEDADLILVVDFNEAVRGSAEFTNDISRLETFIEGREAWGGTSLYDATHYALSRVRGQVGRKAVVIFSDGADTTSTLPEKDVVGYARAVEATVYCVGIHGGEGLFARSPKGFLKKLAEESGGNFFFPDKVSELVRIFSAISEELHSHYALGYTPVRSPDGGWRKIEVRVLRPGTHVRVRQGYVALKRRRPREAAAP